MGSESLIGGFLVSKGVLRPSQVEEILSAQKAGDTRQFGEIAVSKGFVDADTLQSYLGSRPPR